MKVKRRHALVWWFGGLFAFSLSIWMHTPLAIDAVPGGILEHQAAPDAATVNAIQDAWRSAGVYEQARWAMLSDLVFITIYGTGCVLAGLYFRRLSNTKMRVLGWVALAAGIVFVVTDYSETIAQLVQLTRGAGDDELAALASGLGPVKVASFVTTFLAIVTGLVTARLSSGETDS